MGEAVTATIRIQSFRHGQKQGRSARLLIGRRIVVEMACSAGINEKK